MPRRVPGAPIYRAGPQPGGPSMCLTHQTTEKGARQGSPLRACTGGAMERDWPKRPSDRQLQGQKKTERAVSPVAEAGHVPTHVVPPGLPEAKPLSHLHAQLSLGRAATGKNSLASMCAGPLRLRLDSWDPVDCGLPGFSVREGGSPGKKSGAYWPILVAIPF